MTFTIRNVMSDQDAADFLESRDIFTTPVLAVDDEMVVGFRREKIDALLGLPGSRTVQDDDGE